MIRRLGRTLGDGHVRRTRTTIAVLGVVLMAMIWGVTFGQIEEHRTIEAERAETQLSNQVDILGEVLGRAIAQIDQAVLLVRDQYLEEGYALDLARLRRTVLRDDPQFVLISVIGADGYMVATSGATAGGRVYLGDREHFTVHRDRQASGLFVSKPVIGRVSGQPTLQFTRRITGDDGRFLGVVVVSIDPLALSRFYRVLEARERMDVSVVGLDGTERLRVARDGTRHFGGDPADATLMRALAEAPDGVIEQRLSDGTRQRVRYQTIDAAPLVVTVRRDEAEILARFDGVLAEHLFTAIAATLLILLFTALLWRQTATVAASDSALRASEARFRDGIESMSDGFALYDANDLLVSWNSRYEQFFTYLRDRLAPGMSFAEIAALTARAILPGRSDAERAAWVAERIARHRTPGASFVQTLASGRVIDTIERRTAEGGTVSVFRDVTELKEAEKRLIDAQERSARSEAILRDAIENTSEAFVLYDADDRLVLCNERYLEVYPYLRELPLLQGMTFEDIIRAGIGSTYGDPLALADPEAWVAQRLAAHRNPSGTIEQKLANGRWLMITERRTSSGGTVGFRTDITDLKRREAELEEARRRADQANRAKTDFLANMSHEIRTPLNGVVTMIDLLRQGALSDDQRLHAETARSAADQLLHVIGNILDMTKLEAGAIELESVPFELGPLVERCAQTFAAKARLKGVELRTDVAPGVAGWYCGDPTRLRQIVLNLIGNAVKFTARGSVCARVSGEPAGDGRMRLTFEVSDTGIGIAPEAAQGLFRKFSQADASVGRLYGGSGLGLAIVREIVERMGGTAGVSSAPGIGSRFHVTVELALATPAAHESPGGEAGRRFAGLRVLLAEDDDTSRYAAARMLDLIGCQVDAVSDGSQAVLAAQARPYDVMLLDMRMPGLDGPSATARIRAEPGPNRWIPIVAVTANAFTDDIEACRAAGMTDHVAKPITLDILRNALSRVRPAIAADVGADLALAATAPAAPVAGTEGPIDRGAIERNFADLPEADVLRLVEMFIERQPQRFAEMRALAAARSAGDLRRAAHTVKGLAMQFGAVRLAGIAAAIETSPAGEIGAATLAQVAVAEDEFRRAAAALRAIVGARAGQPENAVA